MIKSRKKIVLIVVLLLLVIIGVGCCFYLNFQYPTFEKLKSFNFVRSNSDTLVLLLKVNLHNPNNLDYEVEKSILNLYNNNDYFAKTVIVENTKLLSNSTTEIQLLTYLIMPKLSKIIEKANDTLNIKIKGDIKAKKGFFEYSFPVEIDYNVRIQELIEQLLEDNLKDNKLIKIKSASISELSLDNSTIKINIDIYNPYDISFKLIKFPSKIYLNDDYWGDGDIDDTIDIDPGNFNSGSFLFQSKNTKTIFTLGKAVLRQKGDYVVDGTLYLLFDKYTFQIPYKHKGKIL